MNVETLIKQIYYAYRGKGASRAPTVGEEKYETALAIANRKKNEWAKDPYHKWNTMFKPYAGNEVGTVATSGTTTLTGTNTYFTDYVAGDKITVDGETVRTIDTITSNTVLTVTVAFTNTATGKTFTRTPIMTSAKEYNVHRNFYLPSDKILVDSTDDLEYTLIKPNQRSCGDVYICGINPKKLVFYNDIELKAIGGSLQVPGYYIPNDMVNTTDLVEVDDPNWLIYATAAELARNDPAKDDQFANLQAMANDIYSKMVQANINIGIFNLSVPTNAQNIGSTTEDEWGL